MLPGAPHLHGGKDVDSRIEAPAHNIFKSNRGRDRRRGRGLPGADAVYEGTFSLPKIQHAHMETHGSIAWRTADGRIHVRTSTQTPHLTKIKLAYLFGCTRTQFHVFSEYVGGAGSAASRRLLTEDLCVLAALKTGRPVKWEFTRSEQFTAATTRHPMKITSSWARRRTARSPRCRCTPSPTPAPTATTAVRSSPRPSAPRSPPTAAPTRRAPATRSTRTRCLPAPLRGYGATSRRSPSSPPSTSWAATAGHRPLHDAAHEHDPAARPDPAIWPYPDDGVIGSYGLDQCLDLVEQALASGRGEPSPTATNGWKAAAWPSTPGPRPSHGAPLGSPPGAPGRRTYHLGVGSAEFGNGIRNAQRQVAAAVLDARAIGSTS